MVFTLRYAVHSWLPHIAKYGPSFTSWFQVGVNLLHSAITTTTHRKIDSSPLFRDFKLELFCYTPFQPLPHVRKKDSSPLLRDFKLMLFCYTPFQPLPHVRKKKTPPLYFVTSSWCYFATLRFNHYHTSEKKTPPLYCGTARYKTKKNKTRKHNTT